MIPRGSSAERAHAPYTNTVDLEPELYTKHHQQAHQHTTTLGKHPLHIAVLYSTCVFVYLFIAMVRNYIAINNNARSGPWWADRVR